jgi:hypothetical protein
VSLLRAFRVTPERCTGGASQIIQSWASKLLSLLAYPQQTGLGALAEPDPFLLRNCS